MNAPRNKTRFSYKPYTITKAINYTQGPGYGKTIGLLNAGEVWGRLSTENHSARARPAMAKGVNNGGQKYIWGYNSRLHKSGYIPYSVLAPNLTAKLTGPAGAHRPYGSKQKKRNEVIAGRYDSGRYKVRGNSWTYLRSNPKGTAIGYLKPGDKVNLKYRAKSGYAKVKIVRTGTGTPASYSGWIKTSRLKKRK